MSIGRCSAGLNAVAPSVNARRNAAQKQLLSGKRNTILLTRQPLVQAYLLAQKRERCHNLLQLQVNENSQFKGFCRCTYSSTMYSMCSNVCNSTLDDSHYSHTGFLCGKAT